MLTTASAAIAQPPAPTPLGDWMTDDHSAVIRVEPCGKALCGTIARVLDPAAPAKDINNPDKAMRNHPLVGTTILSGFKPSGKGWTGGTAYDPKSGNSYSSRLALAGPRALDVTGCVMFICRTKHWTRAD
jgi:uncharacterized protein (DUF2147 family)